MKRTFCLLLLLTLVLCSAPSCAETDLLNRIQPLLDAMTEAALVCDVDQLDTAPSVRFASEAIHSLLEIQYTHGEIMLEEGFAFSADSAALSELYQTLFSQGHYEIPSNSISDDIIRNGAELQFVLNNRTSKAGAIPMIMETNGDALTLVCELYMSENPTYDPEADNVSEAEWIGTAEFVLQKSTASPYGYTLLGFQRIMDETDDNPLAVYTNERLGFSFAYPAELTAYMVEDNTGIRGAFPNNELSLTAVVTANAGYTLESYASFIQNAYENSLLSLYTDAGYFTLAYETEELTCYRVVSVTDDNIYEAELRFVTPLADLYGMFAEYLENSFTVFEFSVG